MQPAKIIDDGHAAGNGSIFGSGMGIALDVEREALSRCNTQWKRHIPLALILERCCNFRSRLMKTAKASFLRVSARDVNSS